MANRTYLIQSDAAAPGGYDFEKDFLPEKDILAASKYSIPVFWYALFDSSSVITKPAMTTDGSTVSYPYLVTTIAAAKARFAERRAYMQPLMPQTVASLFDDFARLLDTVETSHIHLETYELWMMDEENFPAHLEACLRAFELPGRGVAPTKLTSTPEWQDLFGQVYIDADDIAGSVEPHLLTGSSWVRPVTWKEGR